MSQYLSVIYGPLVAAALLFFIIAFFSMRTGLVLMAIAMLFSPEFSVGTVGVRDVSIRLEDILIPILSLSWIAQRALRRTGKLITFTPINIPIFLLLMLSVLSTLRGMAAGWVNPLPAFFYIFKTLQYFLVFYLVANHVQNEKQVKFFLWFALLAAGMIGFYTLLQVPKVEIFSEHRITAPFEGAPEPATMGGYMAFLLLIIFSLFLYEKKPITKWIFSVLGLIIFIPFLFTLNRTSYAALFLGLAVIFTIERQKKMIFLVLLAFFIFQAAIPEVRERIAFTWTDAVYEGRELGVDFSFQERIYAFRKLWITWRHSPFIGWGVTSIDMLDSQYARTLHEIVILGLGLWLWIYFRLLKISRWLFDTLEHGTFKGLVLGYMAGTVGLLLHGFGAITFYIVRIMEPYWFVSGLVMALYILRSREFHARQEIPDEADEDAYEPQAAQ